MKVRISDDEGYPIFYCTPSWEKLDKSLPHPVVEITEKEFNWIKQTKDEYDKVQNFLRERSEW